LNELIDRELMISSARLFHQLITLYEKKYLRMSLEQCFLSNFNECPLVHPQLSNLKKLVTGTVVSPLHN